MANMEWAAKWAFYFGFIGFFANVLAIGGSASNPYPLLIFSLILVTPYLYIQFQKGQQSVDQRPDSGQSEPK